MDVCNNKSYFQPVLGRLGIFQFDLFIQNLLSYELVAYVTWGEFLP